MKSARRFKIAADILRRNRKDTRPFRRRAGAVEKGNSKRKDDALTKLINGK